MDTDETETINKLRDEIHNLQDELNKTKDHLKKYTAPSNMKKYYKVQRIFTSEKSYQSYIVWILQERIVS